MALVQCPECRKEIDNTLSNCPECGYPLGKQKIEEDEEHKKRILFRKLEILRTRILVIAVICFVASGVFFYKAFNVKNDYYNSEYSFISKNAYVGGDAYNYIINGTYFTGYSVIASAVLLSGVILFASTINITIKMKECERG